MNSPETLREAINQVAQSPKVAVAVSTATTAIGAAASQDYIHGFLVNASMVFGIIATAVLGGCHIVRFAILRQELKNLRKKSGEIE